jgi:hypothetical protein
MSRPHARRRDNSYPEEAVEGAGLMIKRNPGVTLVWIVKSSGFRPFRAPAPDGSHGVLFNIGEPEECLWFTQGREATREEILDSIESGLPILREAASSQGVVAEFALEGKIEKAMELLPA